MIRALKLELINNIIVNKTSAIEWLRSFLSSNLPRTTITETQFHQRTGHFQFSLIHFKQENRISYNHQVSLLHLNYFFPCTVQLKQENNNVAARLKLSNRPGRYLKSYDPVLPWSPALLPLEDPLPTYHFGAPLGYIVFIDPWQARLSFHNTAEASAASYSLTSSNVHWIQQM